MGRVKESKHFKILPICLKMHCGIKFEARQKEWHEGENAWFVHLCSFPPPPPPPPPPRQGHGPFESLRALREFESLWELSKDSLRLSKLSPLSESSHWWKLWEYSLNHDSKLLWLHKTIYFLNAFKCMYKRLVCLSVIFSVYVFICSTTGC